MVGLASSVLRRLAVLGAALAVAALVLPVLPGRPLAGATDFAVTRFDDPTPDGCKAGDCSLREAIIDANAAPGSDAIALEAGTYALRIPPDGTPDDAADGDLDITTGNLTITGAGAASTIIDMGGVDRVLHVDPWFDGITLELSSVTLQNGSTPNDGGGVLNDGTLALADVTVRWNSAFGGGGVKNEMTMTLSNSSVTANTATLTNSTVEGNTTFSTRGGGLYSAGGTIAVSNSTIAGNVGDNGGGIFNSATLLLTNVTIYANLANSDGAGVFNSGSATLNHATVASNTAIGRGGGISGGGTTTLANTIVAFNGTRSGNNCVGATITSAGHNIFYPLGCGPTAPSDITAADPLLDDLTENGGFSRTTALFVGSPAIDAGSDDCPPPDADQRGIARPLDGDEDGTATCDIGAYEFEPAPPPPTPTPTSNAQGPTATVSVVEPPATGSGGNSGDSLQVWHIAALVATGVAAAATCAALELRRRRVSPSR